MRAGYIVDKDGTERAEYVLFDDGSIAVHQDGHTVPLKSESREMYENVVDSWGYRIDWRSGCSPQK